MNTSFLVRFGSWMAAISGFLLGFAHTFDFISAGGDATAIGIIVVFTAHLLLVFGLIGLNEAQRDRGDWLGTTGMILGVIGTTVVTAVVFVEMAGVSGSDVSTILEADINQVIFSFGPLLFVIGMLLFGVSVLKNMVLPRVGGILLIIGTVIFSIGTMAVGPEALMSALGGIITGGGLIWSGYPIIRNKRDYRVNMISTLLK